MKQRMCPSTPWLTGVVLAVLAGPAGGAEEVRIGGPIPQQVLEDWQARRARCQSVYWKVLCRELVSAGSLNHIPPDDGQFGPLPAHDLWRTREFEFWIDFEALRIRSEMRGMVPYVADDGTTPFEQVHHIHLMEGGTFQTILVPSRNSRPLGNNAFQVRTPTGRAPTQMFEAILQPCFWANGRVFGPDNPYRADRLNDPFNPRLFRVHALQGAPPDQQIVLRAPLQRERADAYLELATVPHMESAIVRWGLVQRDQVQRQFNVIWEEKHGGWTPVQWTMSEVRRDGTPWISAECTVLEMVCNPKLDRIAFQQTPDPGTRFWDEQQNSILVKGEPGQPDIPVELFEIRESAQQRRRFWIVAGVFVAVVGVVATFTKLYRRRPSTR